MKSELIDIFWSVSSTIMKIGGSLLLLPIILTKFSDEELGLWYFFNSVSVFVLMIDFGFSSTMSRNIRYVLSKGRIYKAGVGESIDNSVLMSLEELYQIIKRIYKYIALCATVVLLILTFLIVDLIQKNGLDLHSHIIFWILFCFSVVLNLRYYYGTSVLVGLNEIAKSQRIEFFSLLFNFLITSLLIYLGSGLLGLAVGNLVGFVCRYLLLKRNINIEVIHLNRTQLKTALNFLWPNTWRTGLSNILGYFIKYLSTYFVTFSYGLSDAGTYGLTFQCINVIISFSFIWIQNVYPKLNSYRIENRGGIFYKLFYNRFILAIFTYLLFSGTFLAILKLDIFSISARFLPQAMVVFLLVHMLFDLIINMYGYIIMTGNKVPFIASSSLNVILIIMFNIFFREFKFGLWGILVSNFLAGLLVSYWYWIYRGSKELNNVLEN